MADNPIKFNDIADLDAGIDAVIQELLKLKSASDATFQAMQTEADEVNKVLLEQAEILKKSPIATNAAAIDALVAATKAQKVATDAQNKAQKEQNAKIDNNIKKAKETKTTLAAVTTTQKGNTKATQDATIKAKERLAAQIANINKLKEQAKQEGDVIRQLNVNKKALDQLNKAQKDGTISTADYNRQISLLVKENVDLVKNQDRTKQSTRQLRNSYSVLKSTLDASSDSLDKNGQEYKDLQKITDSTAQEVRDFDRSVSGSDTLVGEYSRGIVNATQQMGGLGGSAANVASKIGFVTQAVGKAADFTASAATKIGFFAKTNDTAAKSSKKLAVNLGDQSDAAESSGANAKGAGGSIGFLIKAQNAASISTNFLTASTLGLSLAITAIPLVGILLVAAGALVAFFTQTQEGIDLMEEGFAIVSNVFDVIIERFARLGKGIALFFSGKFKEGAEEMANSFSDIGTQINDATDAAQKWTKLERELRKETIAFTTANAKAKKQIAELVLESKNQNKTAQERLDALKKAAQIEKKALAERIKLQQKEVDILTLKNKATENLDSETQELADAQSQLDELQKESANTTRNLTNRQNELVRELEREAKEAAALVKTQADLNKAREKANENLKVARKEREAAAEDDPVKQIEKEIEAQKLKITNLKDDEFKFIADKKNAEEQAAMDLEELEQKLFDEKKKRRDEEIKDREKLNDTIADNQRKASEQQIKDLDFEIAANKKAQEQIKNDDALTAEEKLTKEAEHQENIRALRAEKAAEFTFQNAEELRLTTEKFTKLLENEKLTNDQKAIIEAEFAQKLIEIEQEKQDGLKVIKDTAAEEEKKREEDTAAAAVQADLEKADKMAQTAIEVGKFGVSIAEAAGLNAKEAAVFEAIINGAVAVTKSLATLGVPAGLPAAAVAAAQTAIQVAAIKDQPLGKVKLPNIPKFAVGTNYAPGGLSIVGEQGAELIKHGGKFTLAGTMGQGGGMFANLPRGAQVYTAEQTQKMLHDSSFLDQYGSRLSYGANSINTINQNKELVRAMSANNPAKAIVSGFNSVMSKHPSNTVNVDERGFNRYTNERNARVKKLNAKINL